MKAFIVLNDIRIYISQNIVAYPSFHASGKLPFDTVMAQSDEVCQRRSAFRRQNHDSTISVWFAKVLSFIRFDIHEKDWMQSSSNSERSAGNHGVYLT